MARKAPTKSSSASPSPKAAKRTTSSFDAVGEAKANSAAVFQVIDSVRSARNPSEAARSALDAVRTAFGYAYGSYWTIDTKEDALKFTIESGSVNEEFRRATSEAKFREGEGLAGRAWRQRDLVFVPEIALVTDCCRAPIASRAGVKSGFCFPLLVEGKVIGTMDFFALEVLSPTPDRLDALRNIGRLVSAAIERVAREVDNARLSSMMESAPINVMFADREFKIRYANAATIKTLRALEHLIPIKADQIVGQSIDIFHKRPEHQRRLLADPTNLPHVANIQVGPETLELNINPVTDQNRNYLGAMVTWSIVTAKLAMETKIKDDAEQERVQAENLRQKVDAILKTVNALSEGDFTATVPDLGSDAVGQMGAALNQAITSVRTTLEGVRDVSEQLAEASGQLASASEEISTGAQQQASSLEETASTLEEITATVKQNSDSAQQARQLASNSRDIAEKGGQVVGTAVEAMDAINQSSKKIADIITAIDEIAFQTNLLALNAAVEAARAGEQGRGFAVVASEVRNLAQRSATAAKEIKALIQDSVKKVDSGTELVNRSGSTLTEIVTSVKRVTDIVTEIAAASREQSTGIDQVNKAITQMDTVTQRNASQTEEMSATSQTLTEQADQLRDLIAQFKLGREVEAARPARPVRPVGAPVPASRSRLAPAAPAPKQKTKARTVGATKTGKNGHHGGHDLDRIRDGGSGDGFTDF